MTARHSRRRAVAGCAASAAALMLLCPARAAEAQTSLLWSARYDSGGEDTLGAGKPFRVEGSGAVTLAGQTGVDFLMVRYLPDGTLDKARAQVPAGPVFTGRSVVIDGDGRSLWAGSAGPFLTFTLLVRFAFAGDAESLFTATTSLGGYGADQVDFAGDGGLLLAYHYVGFGCAGNVFVTKIGGTKPPWTVLNFGGCLDEAVHIAPDPWGGVVVSETNALRSLLAIDAAGAVVWSRSHQDSDWPWREIPKLALVDGAGNIRVVGQDTSGNFLTIGYEPSGDEVWRRTFDGAGHGEDAPTGLVLDVGGSLYLTGSSAGAGGNPDFATVKYDAAGNLLWTRTYDSGAADVPGGVAVDGAGNAWVTGTSGNDVVTLKYDPSGTQVFSHRFASPGPATVAGVAVDGWGNATVAFSAAGDVFVLRYGQAPVSTGPLVLNTVDPCRAFDSRDPTLGGPNPLAGPSDRVVALTGVCGVPASAKAVSLNVTAVGATQPGSFSLFPADQTLSATSSLNYSAGQIRANNATVGLGTNASLGLRISQGGGTVHVLIDVVGYWE